MVFEDNQVFQQMKSSVVGICEHIAKAYEEDIQNARRRDDRVRLSELYRHLQADILRAQQPLIELAKLLPPDPIVIERTSTIP